MKLTGVKQFVKCMNTARFMCGGVDLQGLLVYPDMVASTDGHIAKVRLMDTGIASPIFIQVPEKGAPDEIELFGKTPNTIGQNLFNGIRLDETEFTIHDVKGFKRYLKDTKHKFIHIDLDDKQQIKSTNQYGESDDVVDLGKFITIEKNLNQVDGLRYNRDLMLIALTKVNTPVNVSFYSNLSATKWHIDETNFYLIMPMRF